jgi:hypothetical protein
MLELTLITRKRQNVALSEWNFVDGEDRCKPPRPEQFSVTAGGKRLQVVRVGFKRRALYAPLKQFDLRVINELYLELSEPVPEGQKVEVQADRSLWPSTISYRGTFEPSRWSPVLHVNQTGYLPNAQKLAMLGFHLGSAGEFDPSKELGGQIPESTVADAWNEFRIVDSAKRTEVFKGRLTRRLDRGFPVACYQRVWEADFSELRREGEYRLMVPGLGVSFPFRVGEGVAADLARTYALGIYHQRCGAANELPFTRFSHGPCHTAPATVPDSSKAFEAANASLEKETSNWSSNARHTAPRLRSFAASLYPFVRRNPVDVSGGHHDAGDYSKYTINSATFIHCLVTAVDAFPGVAELDNLGLPESGDGKSDVLQEAKWEAGFLAKMQDEDGGFYFLVYPRDREYEIDVTPDHGDPQIVFPKTTSATAAAVAALAQCASSPTFKQQFPEAARACLESAKKGWSFLDQAIAKHGKDGAYQKITHYGDDFMHDDELAWAACEMYLATGSDRIHKRLLEWLDPADPNTRKWGWWRLYASYGAAIRSYGLAVKAGKAKREQLHPELRRLCEDELVSAAEDQLKRAHASAYGISFPEETKRTMTAGWFFASDAMFDLAVASQLDYPEKNDPREKYRDALLSNLNYEQGCNPVNVTYLTGTGWKRQREIVHQFAQNDSRVLPPSGIPLGCIQAGITWVSVYGKEPNLLSFPPDGSNSDPYPIYDRWTDAFNLSQEFVIVNQARGLAALSWLMAQTSLRRQPWKAGPARIVKMTEAIPAARYELRVEGLDLVQARIVWEAESQEPQFGRALVVQRTPKWVEAEAEMPDGRRVFARFDQR